MFKYNGDKCIDIGQDELIVVGTGVLKGSTNCGRHLGDINLADKDVEDVQGNLGVVAVEDGTVGEDSDESFLDDDVGRGDREEFGDE